MNPAKRALAWMRQIVAREYRVYKANSAGVRREAVIAEAAVMPAAMREEKAPAGEKAEQAVPQVLLPAEGAFRRIVRQDVAAKQKALMPVSVREYAHKARPDRIPNERQLPKRFIGTPVSARIRARGKYPSNLTCRTASRRSV
ncbi:MAG: hypothetical protein V8T87_09680 [Victivallales bacterium]